MPRLTAVAILILLSTGLIAGAEARMYIVDDDGPANYESIGGAVMAAKDGDIIRLRPGTYEEHLVLDKMLSIAYLPGEEDQERILTGDGSEIGIEVLADGCKIEGLTIENFRGPGIYVDSDGNEIRDNVLVDNVIGVALNGSAGNVLDGNQESGSLTGILLMGSNDNTISNNFAEGCILSGIVLASSQNNAITESTSTDCLSGMYLNTMSNNNRLQENLISECRHGVLMERSCQDNEVIECRLENITSSTGREDILNQLTINAIVRDNVAIGLVTSSGNRLVQNTVIGSPNGAVLISSDGNVLQNNEFKETDYGIQLLESSSNNLAENRLTDVGLGLYVDAASEEGFDNQIAESNQIDGMPIVYHYRISGLKIQDKICSHLTLAYCLNCTLENNTITNDMLGLINSDDNLLQENNVSNGYGMLLRNSGSNTLKKNRACDNRLDGIHLIGSRSNEIYDSHLSQNGRAGLLISKSSDDNQVVGNTVSDNLIGIGIEDSEVNRLYHNNLVDNAEQAADNGENIWDWGQVKGGNYWSDHECVGNPCQNDPRVIGENATDYYPFQDRDGWL